MVNMRACRACGRPSAEVRWLDFLIDDRPVYAHVEGPYCGACALHLDLYWRRQADPQRVNYSTAWHSTPARGGVFA